MTFKQNRKYHVNIEILLLVVVSFFLSTIRQVYEIGCQWRYGANDLSKSPRELTQSGY